MKKNLLQYLSIPVVLILLLVTFVSPVSAKGQAHITFKGLSFIGSKGYVFRFEATGDVKAKNIPAFIRIGKHAYDLKCRSSDSADLVCATDNSLKGYVGRSVQGAVGGFPFTAVVPKPVVKLKTYNCFGIYDFDPNNVWSQIGTYCKRATQPIDATIEYYNPVWNSNEPFTYYYYEDGSQTVCNYGAPNWGPGYYYDYPSNC